MLYDWRWEREFSEKRIKSQEPSIAQLCFLIVIPTLIAIILMAVWVSAAKYVDVGGHADNILSHYERIFQNGSS
jgi:hypothetical protein